LRKRRGQILLLSVLGIVIILLSVSTLLIKTSILPLTLSQSKYRETASQLYYGSQAAISKGLADASNNLNHRAAASNYQNYTSLDELTGQENQGLDLIDEWQRDMMRNNPAAGVCVNFSIPMFECEWYNPLKRSGYSSAISNVSISMKGMGFEGLKDEVEINFTSTILELIESDGRETTFKIRFMKENGEPIEKMPRNLVNVLSEVYYRDQEYRTFNETETGSVRNLGNGTFLVSYISNTNNITYNLDLLRENITEIPPGSLISYKSVSTDVSTGWQHISTRKTSDNLQLYIDGVLIDSDDVTGYGSISNDQTINMFSGETYSWLLDEFRFDKSSRTDDWLDANYANHHSSGFLDIGGPETVDQGDWGYRRNLTIESSYLESSLNGFPLLVRLPASFDYNHANDSGKDIRFNLTGVELDYEIEEWDPGGSSIIWVRVPDVPSTSDTIIEMYYGNPDAQDDQSPAAVWDGYNMVHHLEEGSGTAIDSTSYGNHGTYSGNQGIDGFIDGGCNFYEGENLEVTSDPSIDPGSGGFIISLWANLPDANNVTLFSKWKEPEGIGYRFFINELGELVFMIDDNDDNATKNKLLDIVDTAESMYQSGERVSAHSKLLELRAKLNPESDESVIEGDLETGGILYRIDRLLDQLRPHIRVVARDQRGITVSTCGELTSSTEDGYGPVISESQVQPIQCEYDETITLEAQADDRWYGNSSIEKVEYFISDTEPQGQSGTGIAMTPVDGALDSTIEDMEANFSSNDLNPGENNIWIHAKDSEGNWGSYETIQVTLVPDNELHIEIIDLQGSYYWSWSYWRWIYWARATVKAVDGNGDPVADASIHGVWSGDVSWEGYGVTDVDGTYEFTQYTSSYYWRSNNEFTFTADSASKTGYEWDGVSDSETIYVP